MHAKVYVFSGLLGAALLLQGCARKDPTQHNSVGNLKKAALTALRQGRHEDAVKPLEKLVSRHPDDSAIAKMKLSLANCYFAEEEYEPAFQLYEHFSQAYPADSHADFAKYRAILSKYRQTLSADRDQAATEETIRVCKEYQDNLSFQHFRNEVLALHQTCNQKMIDREIYVLNFYLDRNKLEAAKKRLDNLKVHYGSKQDDLMPRLLYLEAKIAQRSNDSKLLQQNIDLLDSKFQKSPFTKMAQNLNSPRVFRF